MKKSVIRIMIQIIAVIGFCSFVQTAMAHAILVRSIPDKEAVLTGNLPKVIQLWFNDAVGKRYAALAVINTEGKRVDNRDGGLDSSDRSLLKATIKDDVPPGKYTVRYRVQSADGHIITGKYYFTLEGKQEEKQ